MSGERIQVVERIPRASGATTYVLNAVGPAGVGRSTVLHSKHGSFVCLNPTCQGWDKAGDDRSKPCRHTRAALECYSQYGDAEFPERFGLSEPE